MASEQQPQLPPPPPPPPLFAKFGVDISQHVYVPRHEVLTEEGGAAVLRAYKLCENQMPRIFRSDPMVQHLQHQRGAPLRKNAIIAIYRSSETSGVYPYYRMVIDGLSPHVRATTTRAKTVPSATKKKKRTRRKPQPKTGAAST